MRVCGVGIVRQAARSERICLPSSPLAVDGKVGWKTMRDTTMAIPPSLGGEDSKTALGARGLLSVGMSGIKIIATRRCSRLSIRGCREPVCWRYWVRPSSTEHSCFIHRQRLRHKETATESHQYGELRISESTYTAHPSQSLTLHTSLGEIKVSSWRPESQELGKLTQSRSSYSAKQCPRLQRWVHSCRNPPPGGTEAEIL